VTLRRILGFAAVVLALAGIGFMAWRSRSYLETDDELDGAVPVPVDMEE
jgi:hypothetical protein